MGHDFHFNTLMEREELDVGSINDVPIAVAAFFRAPSEVLLHSGFVWSGAKLCRDAATNVVVLLLSRQGQSKSLRLPASMPRRPEFLDLVNLVQTNIGCVMKVF